jgi:hypothetical protein
MVKKITVHPLRLWERLLDTMFVPVMYLLQFPVIESPQRTHRWNNQKLRPQEVAYLDNACMVRVTGTEKAARHWWWKIPIFHIPLLGGWRSYVVLRPEYFITSEWYVGWIAGDVVGISRIPLGGNVRLLIGDGDVLFFGIYADGHRVPIEKIGHGVIGNGGLWKRTPLL